jgi:hypothetical protein
MSRIAICFAVAGLSICGFRGAEAAEGIGKTGNELLTECGTGPVQNASVSYETGVCVGYISAVMEISVLSSAVCPPLGSTYGQDIDIVKKYLVDNPETRNAGAYWLVIDALSKAFPCQSKATQPSKPR